MSDERKSPAEDDFIERIRRRASRNHSRPSGGDDAPPRSHSSLITHHSSLVAGIGDDAAVLRPTKGHETIISVDLLIEDVDFRLSTSEPAALGHKALAVSLSDIAAMGARPRFALLSVGLPARVWRGPFLEKFYEGFFRLAATHGVALVGGDVSRAPERVVVDSIVVGEVRRGRAVLRSGARPGDQLFVTGALGGAAAGLRLLEASARGRSESAADARRAESSHAASRKARAASRDKFGAAARELVGRQTRPTPRVEWGAYLGERRLATAMIDLSDGLSSDLGRLCRESRVGALVESELLPLHPRLRADAGRARDENPALLSSLRESAFALAAHGGEDFELLFAVRPRDAAKLPAALGGVPVTRVGEIRERRFGVKLARDGRARAFRPAGFDHFARPA